MAEKHTKEEFWKLYKKLPPALKNALADEETGNNIERICSRYKIEDCLDKMVDYVGDALVGLLPPPDFQETLIRELNLEENQAKKISYEIHRFIFYPVKKELEELYDLKAESVRPEEISDKDKTAEEPIEKEVKKEEAAEEKRQETKPKSKEEWSSGDSYREPIA